MYFRSTFGYDNANIQNRSFLQQDHSYSPQFCFIAVASIGKQNNHTISNSNTLQYHLTNFKDHHDITVLAGQEIVDVRSKQNAFETRYFPSDITAEKALANMGLGSAPPGSSQPLPTSFEQPPSRIFSFFGRLVMLMMINIWPLSICVPTDLQNLVQKMEHWYFLPVLWPGDFPKKNSWTM